MASSCQARTPPRPLPPPPPPPPSLQIHRSEERLRDSVQNLTDLEGSVRAAFGGDGQLAAASWDAAGAAAAAAAAQAATPQAGPAAEPAPQVQRAQQRRRRGGRDSGLSSTLAIPEQLRDFWFPVEFSASLEEDKMVPFELFGQVRCEQGGACTAGGVFGCVCQGRALP